MRDDKAAQAAFREAERRYGTRGGVPLNPGAIRRARRIAFEKGAAWQREQPVEITDEMVERAARAILKDDPAFNDVYSIADYQAMARHALEAALNGGES